MYYKITYNGVEERFNSVDSASKRGEELLKQKDVKSIRVEAFVHNRPDAKPVRYYDMEKP